MATPDPYVPGHGDTRYRVRHYDLVIDYRPMTNHLAGVATLDVEIAEATTQIELDLSGLHVNKVTVDRRPARYRHANRRVTVPVGAREPGDRLRVVVQYAGKPNPVPGIHGSAGWEELTDGVLVGSQPYGSPSWFPCNDDAADKATYRIAVSAPKEYTVVANGTLATKGARGSSATWVYTMDHPMSPYLATVQIGMYVTELRPGPVPVEIVRPATVRAGEGTAFERQVEMVEVFADLFGPYPFDQYRAVITDDPLEIPLEAQGLSSFGRNFARNAWDNERLVAHELAHQWFGNAVTASQLEDIWLHEGFACYSEWLWSQASGRESTQRRAAHHWERLSREPQDLLVGRPGAADMFDDRIYKRGALTVHALRAAMGDRAFFDMLRAWVARYSGGTVSTPQLAAHCAEFTDAPVGDVLDAWLYRTPLPALPVIG